MSSSISIRDRRVSIAYVLGVVVMAGFVVIAMGWRGAADLRLVAFQMPYLVSGAMVGLALIASALALLSVHVDRAEAAEERRMLAELQREALRLRAERAER